MFEINISKFENIEKLLEFLSGRGSLYFKGTTIFVAAFDIDIEMFAKHIGKILGVGNFMIKNVDVDSYGLYPQTIFDWMKKQHYEYDVLKLEKEKQAELNEYMNLLERFEGFLESNGKESDTDG